MRTIPVVTSPHKVRAKLAAVAALFTARKTGHLFDVHEDNSTNHKDDTGHNAGIVEKAVMVRFFALF